MTVVSHILSLLAGWMLDLRFGDPERLPHPVVWFGRAIARCEHRFNRGHHRRLKGGLTAVVLIAGVYGVAWLLRWAADSIVPALNVGGVELRLSLLFDVVAVFYCLAGTTLIREVRAVFMAVDRSLAEGRQQVARIVGRDTSALTAQEVRTAALETLAENLSDGVVAPLFWYAVGGTPLMLTYKMVNTLDSMIGYRTERYRDFGCVAARSDDVANYVPARLTALLMVLSGGGAGRLRERLSFVRRYGRQHASPNSGYPEAALAAILDCRFGGPHDYFGQRFDKPYIGHHERLFTTADMELAVSVNRRTEMMMVALCVASSLL